MIVEIKYEEKENKPTAGVMFDLSDESYLAKGLLTEKETRDQVIADLKKVITKLENRKD